MLSNTTRDGFGPAGHCERIEAVPRLPRDHLGMAPLAMTDTSAQAVDTRAHYATISQRVQGGWRSEG
jgi:hypothetical protein